LGWRKQAVAKVLPTTLAGDPNAPLTVTTLSDEERRERARQAIREAFAELHAMNEGQPREPVLQVVGPIDDAAPPDEAG
jgi:hypothetical protein